MHLDIGSVPTRQAGDSDPIRALVTHWTSLATQLPAETGSGTTGSGNAIGGTGEQRDQL